MEINTARMPRWAIGAGVLLLLWSLMGIWSFYSELTITPEAAAAMPPEQRALWDSMPGWLWGVFAIAVFSALLGSIAMLARKSFARHLWLLSLAAVIVQFTYVFLVMPVLSVIGPSAIPFPALIIAVAAAAWLFAKSWTAKGWLQ
ncbi:MAG: sugar transporter [Rhizobiales bacterium]|nr:sugar transporter [Hyphomicrobiales bacterium]